jgi:hypothetical protein
LPVFFFIRAPQQRRADAALSQRDAAFAFYRDPQNAFEFVPYMAGFPGDAGIAG